MWPEIAAAVDEDHIQFRGEVIKVDPRVESEHSTYMDPLTYNPSEIGEPKPAALKTTPLKHKRKTSVRRRKV